MTLFVLLPAYNEQDALPSLIPGIEDAVSAAALLTRIVIVNDGSTDRTAERADILRKAYPVELVTHPINRGLGETIRDGIEYCVAEGGPGDVIVRMDCDDTQDPACIPSLVRRIRAECDVVIASRYQPGGGESGLTGVRKALSRGAGLFMRAMFPIRGIRDYSSGYRAYRWEILRDALDLYGNAFIEQKHLGFSCTLEKLVKLDMLGARFGEVAHMLRYDRKRSESKMACRPTTWGYLTLALKYSPWFGLRRRQWRRRIEHLKARNRPNRATRPEMKPCAASPAA